MKIEEGPLLPYDVCMTDTSQIWNLWTAMLTAWIVRVVDENIWNSFLQNIFPWKTVDQVLSDKNLALILAFSISIYNRLKNWDFSDDPKKYSVSDLKEFLSMKISYLWVIESPFSEKLLWPIKKIVFWFPGEYTEDDMKKAWLLYNWYYDWIDSLRSKFTLTPRDAHIASKNSEDKIPFLKWFHWFVSIINASWLSSQLWEE